MTKERSIRDYANEFITLSKDLKGYVHNENMAEYFERLNDLEDLLFKQGKIAEEPSLLLHMNISVSNGKESKKLEGFVTGVEFSPMGGLAAIVLKGHPKPIKYELGITHISPVKEDPNHPKI